MREEDRQTVAAVVVTYNRKELLHECLQALLHQTRPLDGIIIIDNASTDGTHEFLSQRGYLSNPIVDYVRLPENTGGAGGFHEGVKRGHDSGYDWLWLMDDDAEPKQDALEKLLESGLHQKDETVGLATLKVGIDGKIQKIHRGWYDVRKLKPHQLSDDEYKKPLAKIGYSSFVGLMIRSRVIDVVGLPRADFFLWYDDVEFCLRLLKRGKLYLVRESVIKHKDGRAESLSRRQRRLPLGQYWRAYYGFRNPLLILKEHESSVMGRAIGYTLAAYRLSRMLAGIIFYDDYKVIRIRILLLAFKHGVMGYGGKTIDPASLKIGHALPQKISARS